MLIEYFFSLLVPLFLHCCLVHADGEGKLKRRQFWSFPTAHVLEGK